jgi:hypothetical protein
LSASTRLCISHFTPLPGMVGSNAKVAEAVARRLADARIEDTDEPAHVRRG